MLVRQLRRLITILCALTVGLCALLLGAAEPAVGLGPDDAISAEATNLSRSGAAADATIVVAPDGRVQAFWWDKFDGLTTAIYDGEAWSDPRLASIYIPVIKQDETLYQPTGVMPFIAGDMSGRAHAFWVGPERIEQTASASQTDAVPPLLHSQLDVGATRWSAAQRVADGATAWTMGSAPDGTLHLLFFMSKQSDAAVAGVYHRRSTDRGATWSSPVLLQRSLYVRGATPTTALLRVVADADGGVYATWRDVQSAKMLYARSTDGGATWGEPTDLGEALGAAGDSYLATTSQGLVFLWDTDPLQARGRLFQKQSGDKGDTWGDAVRTMPDAQVSLNRISLGALRDGRLLAVLADPNAGLGLAVWDATTVSAEKPTGWSQFKSMQMSGTDASAVGRWSLAVRDDEVVLVGQGEDADVWAVPVPLADLTPAYTTSIERAWGDPLGKPQVGEDGWDAPANLSRSGSASQAVIVVGSSRRLQVFWWDQFDGLMSAYFDGDTWFGPVSAPILVGATVRDQIVAQPLAQMPHITGDGKGRAHAWWLAVGQGGREGALMHAALDLGDTRWTAPQAIAQGVLKWETFVSPGGDSHVLAIRGVETADALAGIHHVVLDDEGRVAGSPQLLYRSIYYRTAALEELYLSGATDGTGSVLVAWTGPKGAGVLTARSEDDGQSWSEPKGAPHDGWGAPLIATAGKGQFLILWQTAGGGQGEVYQQLSSDGGKMSEPVRVLEGTSVRSDEADFVVDQKLGLLFVASGTSLARWDPEQAEGLQGGWSQPQTLFPQLQDVELQRTLYLSAQTVTVHEGRLALVGQEQAGDIWATGRDLDLAWLYAPPPLWAGPVVGETQGVPDVPAVALDGDGQMHAIWSERDAQGNPGNRLCYASGEGSQTGTPTYVIEALDGKAEQPSMVALGDRLHLVWSGGANGRVYYSQCFARDAGSRAGWSEPVALPEPPGAGGLGGWPRIVADRAGVLHVVYSVPANEARGIYYTRSTDGGLTWQPARAVCDAAQQGWASVAYPALAVGADDTLHAVWVLTSLSGSSVPEAIYYARSNDSGETWSAPLGVAFGSYTWPAVAALAIGDVHVIWRDLSREGVWSHIRSTDGRQWRIVGQPQGFRGIAGRAAALSDGVGSIHLLGVERRDGAGPVLHHSLWQTATERWTAQDDQPLGLRFDPLGGLGAALDPEAGTLSVALPAKWLVEDSEQSGLLQLRRAVEPVKLPEAVVRTDLTPVATTMPEPTATPRPTPTVPSAAPAPSAAIGIGPLTLPYAGLAGLLVTAMCVTVVVLSSMRLRRGR